MVEGTAERPECGDCEGKYYSNRLMCPTAIGAFARSGG